MKLFVNFLKIRSKFLMLFLFIFLFTLWIIRIKSGSISENVEQCVKCEKYDAGGHKNTYINNKYEKNDQIENKDNIPDLLKRYGEIHRKIMDPNDNSIKKRFFVHRAYIHNGWSNRFQSLLSAFLFCVVSDRAILVDWNIGHRADDSFLMPFDTWLLEDALKKLPNVIPREDQWAILDTDHGSRRIPIDTLLCENYTNTWSDATVIVNKGTAISWIELVWHSLHYNELLRKNGIYYGTVSSTLAKYLLLPHPSVSVAVEEFIAQNFGTYTIGLHIRAGEDQLGTKAELPTKQLHCARLLSQTLPLSLRKKLVYFVATDTPDWYTKAEAYLQQQIPEDFAQGLPAPRVVRQSVNLKSGMVGNKNERENNQQRIAAMVDLWLLSKTDDAILTQGSTYGEMSQLLSGNNPLFVTRQSHCVRYLAHEAPNMWIDKYLLRHFREGNGKCYGDSYPISLAHTNGMGQGFDLTVSDPEKYILLSNWATVSYVN